MNTKNSKNRYRRLVGVEVLENRCLLSASTIDVGAVYYESAPTESGSGRDLAADYIYVSFCGGAEGTEMTEVTIDMMATDGAERHAYIDLGDENPEGVRGAYASVPLEFETDGFTVVGYSLTENNTLLTVQLSGFTAGDVLKIKCDVDEVLSTSSLDAEVTGAEFEVTSALSASFTANYFEDLSVSAVPFYDVFAATQEKYDIDGLPNDNFDNEWATIPPGDGLPQPVYTAGAFTSAIQIPLPCTISGKVYEDVDYNEDYDPMIDRLLEDVSIQLWKLNASTGQYEWVETHQTDENGEYLFDIEAGTYRLFEVTPDGFKDVTSFVGTINGVPVGTQVDANELTDIGVRGGEDSIHNDFSEYVPASISGYVWLEDDLDDILDVGIEEMLEGVQIDLISTTGILLRTTKTDERGYYEFLDLLPGTYGVFEHQPEEYLNGGQYVGTVDGVENGQVSDIDLTDHIVLLSRNEGIHYDFFEYPYAEISGYVFQDGDTLVLKEGEALPSDVWERYPGVRDATDNPIYGVKLILADANGNPILDSNGKETIAYTDAKGYYHFYVKPGTYTILEEQPTDYVDGWDRAGSLGGQSVNPNGDKHYDVDVNYGDHGKEYNFSEIVVQWVPNEGGGGTPSLRQVPARPNLSAGGSSPVMPYTYSPSPSMGGGLLMGGSGGGGGYSFHLGVLSGVMTTTAEAASIVEANTLNAAATAAQVTVQNGLTTVLNAANNVFNPESWEGLAMDRIRWMLAENSKNPSDAFFGVDGARALTGDFNGDGKDELAIFLNGFWFIDINGNQVWDDYDLWAQLGGPGDQPIVGDWDHDGKADIGVFGRPWKNDPRVAIHELGLPDAENMRRGEFKHIPSEKAIAGYWYAKHTRTGQIKQDVIDHVFQLGQDGDIAVAGDWNGDGVWSVGLFCDGRWTIDVNGDGQLDDRDETFQFGSKGDIPVVGSWDGSAISRVGVFRDGTWTLDVQGTRDIASAEVRQQGRSGEMPIVADFEGTGTPELATVRNVQTGDVQMATASENVVQ